MKSVKLVLSVVISQNSSFSDEITANAETEAIVKELFTIRIQTFDKSSCPLDHIHTGSFALKRGMNIAIKSDFHGTMSEYF